MKTTIGIIIGAASMCWNPEPTGVFESARAENLVEQLDRAFENAIA